MTDPGIRVLSPWKAASSQQVSGVVSLLTAAWLAIPSAAIADRNLEDRLVQIQVTRQIQNPFLPWQFSPSSSASGYGYFINDAQVLTTENLVRNHTLVELVRAQTGEKITARVEIADHLLNLAILRIEGAPVSDQAASFEAINPLELNDSVTILQFDADRKVQHSAAIVTQIGVTRLPSAPYSLLSFRLLSDLDVNGEGAPVIQDGKLSGLIVSYQSSARIAVMVSDPFLSRFVKDALKAPYLGPASAGFSWRSLVDPAKRKYLKLGTEKDGIQVATPLRGTPGGLTLKPLDVILKWDGHALDSLGYYNDPHFGRLQFSHLVRGKRSPGDKVPITVFRDGKAQQLDMQLAGDPDLSALVPENVTRKRAEYLVEGGFIIRELDMAYMRALGADWRSRADSRLIHYYLNSRSTDYEPGDRIVVLVGVLPDRINIGYHKYHNQVIKTVNGQAVNNLQDVFRILDTDGALQNFRFQSGGVDLALDQEELPEANERIMTRYRIPELRFQAEPSAQASADPHRNENRKPSKRLAASAP